MRSPSLKATRRRGGRDHQVHLLERGAEVLGDLRPHPLGVAVVGVVVARRERVGADHDPALDLVAEAVVARVARTSRAGRRRSVRACRSGRRRSAPGWRWPRRARSRSRPTLRARRAAASISSTARRAPRSARSRSRHCSPRPARGPPRSRPQTPKRTPSRRSAVGSVDLSGMLERGGVARVAARRGGAAAARRRRRRA